MTSAALASSCSQLNVLSTAPAKPPIGPLQLNQEPEEGVHYLHGGPVLSDLERERFPPELLDRSIACKDLHGVVPYSPLGSLVR